MELLLNLDKFKSFLSLKERDFLLW